MNKGLIIGFVIVLAVALSYPFLPKVSSGGAPGGAAAPAPAAEAAPVVLEPPLLNAGNLANTVWQVKGFSVNLLPGGQASAQTPIGQVQGTWQVNGANITISAMGQTVTAQISGNQILHEGKPIQRLQ